MESEKELLIRVSIETFLLFLIGVFAATLIRAVVEDGLVWLSTVVPAVFWGLLATRLLITVVSVYKRVNKRL